MKSRPLPFVAHFLGKTNVLPATSGREAGEQRLAVGDGHWPWAAPLNLAGQLQVSVRPEKIAFVGEQACSLGGRVSTRIFQGNHWLFQVDTACGMVTVIRQNDGQSLPSEGQTVRLGWNAQDMRVDVA
jgi:putative spermidine/putrescine transport system ATP-binding protein